MRRWLFALALLAGLLALAACAAQEAPKEEAKPAAPAAAPAAPAAQPGWEQEWERVLAAAKKEGRIVIMGPPGADVRRALTEPFSAKYGITVEYAAGRGGEFAARLNSERQAGQYLWDIHVGATTTPTTVLKPMGALDPIEPALILPDVKDPKNWREGKLPFMDKDRRFVWAMVLFSKEGFFVNSNLVKPEEFKSYRDLLDPKWKGKILLHDPSIPGSGDTMITLFYLHPNLGPDFVRAFARQEPFITRNYEQIAEWLGVGRYPIAVGGSKDVIKPMMKAGVPMAFVTPRQLKEGGSKVVGMGAVMLMNRPPHPNAAKLYLNWLLSKEGQLEHSRATGFPSTRTDVPTDHVEPWVIPLENYVLLSGEEVDAMRQQVRDFAKEAFGIR